MGSRQRRQYADLSKPRTHWDLRVELPQDGMRLDRFMADRVRWRSRNQLQEMIEEGLVSVNGTVRAKSSVRLKDQDRVVIASPDDGEGIDPADIPIEVLLDDSELIAVNKRPGIVVHPTSGHTLTNVLSAMHARFRDTKNPANDRVPHICHRIDRETSGVLLFAFSERLKAHVSAQFEARTVKKQYLALVHGRMSADEGTIDVPILHRTEGWPRLVVDDEGQASRTDWRVESDFGGAQLVRFFPRTGRTHQIRVHAAHVGNPLLCDDTYGGARPAFASVLLDGKVAGDDPNEPPILERVALHSARLELIHPTTGERYVVEAPLPADMCSAALALACHPRPSTSTTPAGSA
jgi:23S rRNA pseudouridine1911/1915/1917 synthase